MILKSTPSYSDPTFGFNIQNDNILKTAFVETIKPKSLASKIFSNPIYTNNKPRGDFVTSIHGTRVVNSADSLKRLWLLHEKGVLELSFTFELENKLSLKEVSKVTN